jgi:Mor family transcriptional regulator
MAKPKGCTSLGRKFKGRTSKGYKSQGRTSQGSAFVEDLILSCTGEGVSSETAQKAVRALCRYYGGQMVYIPAKKEDGISAENPRRVITDAAGDCAAEQIVRKIMRLYGNTQIYIPLERTAFRKIIALEIYKRYSKNDVTMNDLAREYNISFTCAYNFWKAGRHEKLKPSMPYLPFLELAKIQ